MDWDETFLGPPELELAWAAGELGQLRTRLEPGQALRFVDAYVAAGGPADPVGPEELAQLVRDKIRAEISYSRTMVCGQLRPGA